MSKSGFLEYCKQSIQARDEHTDGIRSSGLHFINVKPSSNKQIIGNCLCPKMAALRRQGCLLPKLKFRGICCQPKKLNGSSHLLHTPKRGSRPLCSTAFCSWVAHTSAQTHVSEAQLQRNRLPKTELHSL
jgi:hypothetical protein